jgi:hypothetical protein
MRCACQPQPAGKLSSAEKSGKGQEENKTRNQKPETFSP